MLMSELFDRTELFVIDIDGTFRYGNTIASGAMEFVQLIIERKKRFMFFTNNSSQTSEKYIQELNAAGCDLQPNQMMTTADVAVHYLKKQYENQPIYVVGSRDLCDYFRKQGLTIADENWEEAKVVLATYDKELTYDKLEKACRLIQKGAEFVATHDDVVCPVEGGFIPDCGAIVASLVSACKVNPKVIGKPHKETLDMILEVANTSEEHVTFIGDRLETDIAIGSRHGANTILVYGGASKKSDIERTKIYPTMECESLGDLYERIKSYDS